MDLANFLNSINFKNVSKSNKGWVTFSCPLAPYKQEHGFTEDSNPSAGAIMDDMGEVYWNCFCCKSSGRVTKLLNYLGRKTAVDYSAKITDLENLVQFLDFDDFYYKKANPEVDEEIKPYIWEKLFSEFDNESASYLAGRGISGKTARKLGLKYNKEDRRIVFPFIRNGKVYGFSGRAIDSSVKKKIKNSVFNTHNFILGEHLWKGKPTVIVEGLFAYAKLHELGISDDYDIGALCGVDYTHQQVKILWDKGLPVIVFLDSDAPGVSATMSLCKDLSAEIPVTYVKYKKPNDDIDLLTKEEIEDMLRTASIYGTVNLDI